MHREWLSNAYLLADEPGGTAVFVDSGAPLEPLHDVVEREGLTVTHLLTTHSHHDHVAGDEELVERYGLEIVKGAVETGGLSIQALETPGHADDHLAFVANETVAFTADILFKDAVGGEDATLLVWSPDYDGKGKAMVRFPDGREAIVGGSRVER